MLNDGVEAFLFHAKVVNTGWQARELVSAIPARYGRTLFSGLRVEGSHLGAGDDRTGSVGNSSGNRPNGCLRDYWNRGHPARDDRNEQRQRSIHNDSDNFSGISSRSGAKPSRTHEAGLTRPQAPQTLKRFLLIFNNRIFDSNVDRGMPNLAAAPVGPNIRPRLSFRAASIISFSCARSLPGSSIWFFGSVRDGCCGNQFSSIEKVSVSQSITERSMTFCNSRMFPGQGYN